MLSMVPPVLCIVTYPKAKVLAGDGTTSALASTAFWVPGSTFKLPSVVI